MIRMYIHFKPLKFFLVTGFILILLGIINGIILLSNPQFIFGDATVSILIIVGFQIIFFGLLADQTSYGKK